MKLGADFCCGIGGISQGMKLAGIKPALGVDIWDRAIEVYQKNFPVSKS
ncbi:putative C-5 cytosine-specific DNA methylase [Tetraselmis virus 1]|uniref:Putative C-5 cytosine-specific DNA methylase n=1 Tax=Tetraselmis virus 1 TaxID=2060617 RepID=A0A2P0VNF2_9VIRU|nr:putative C-5 cytosine-specific DNA methylase [Tetraselmis virus 1]AUF82423.1 putative C-5 cytosine-specific DNA methylase [Tetraselmis virus 1]